MKTLPEIRAFVAEVRRDSYREATDETAFLLVDRARQEEVFDVLRSAFRIVDDALAADESDPLHAVRDAMFALYEMRTHLPAGGPSYPFLDFYLYLGLVLDAVEAGTSPSADGLTQQMRSGLQSDIGLVGA